MVDCTGIKSGSNRLQSNRSLQTKKKRRVERENKKLSIKRRISLMKTEETSEEEITIIYDDESEHDIDNLNECLECRSSEQQENSDAWMECSGKQCGNW